MNVNYRVVSLDPGGTTGYAIYDAEFPVASLTKREPIEDRLTVGHLGPEDHHEELYDLLELQHIRDFYLVTESFEFRQGNQRNNINLMSKEYIGVAKLFAQQRGLIGSKRVRYYEQTAGLAKPFVTDEKLRIMNWWTPGMKHANDAARHLVFFLVNKQGRTDLIQSWRNL